MDIICKKIDYKAYVTREKRGVKQFLLRFQNALYGTMVAIMIYYRKFTKSLTSIGFEINPYDQCVANKVIDGSHMTICFHVDDCKMNHREHKANDFMIKWLHKEYESIFEDGSGKMSVIRGKVHEYLGMTIYYTVHGKVRITMLSYIEYIITAFKNAYSKWKGTKSSAAPNNIFVVNKDCKKLDQEKVVEFHNLVANNLYDTKKARYDT